MDVLEIHDNKETADIFQCLMATLLTTNCCRQKLLK